MAIGDVLVGLDIGFSDLNLVVAKVNNFNQLDIVCSYSKPSENFDKNMKLNKSNFEKSFMEILKEIQKDSGLRIKSCYVTIPGIYIDVQQIENVIETKDKLKIVNKSDILELIDKARVENPKDLYTDIDLVPYKFVLDNGEFVKDPIGKKSKDLIMLSQIIYGKDNYIDDVLDVFEKLNLYVDEFVPVSISEKEMLVDKKKIINNIMVLNFEDQNIELGIYINDALIYSNTLDIGLDILTKVIAHNLEISIEEAEMLRKQYPLALKSHIENDNNILLKTYMSTDMRKKTIKTSELIDIIEESLKRIFEHIGKEISEKGIKEYIDLIIMTGDILKIKGSHILATSTLNISVKREAKEKYVPGNEKVFRAFSILKYISNKTYKLMDAASIVEVKEDKNALKKILEGIRDFFYS